MTNPEPPLDENRLRQLQASEIALGLLADEEARRALARDPLLAAEVARASAEFASLALGAAPVSPPPQVFERLKAQIAQDALQPQPTAHPSATHQPATHQRAAVAESVRASSASPSGSWLSRLLESLPFWRAMAGAGFASTAGLAAAMLGGLLAPAPVGVQTRPGTTAPPEIATAPSGQPVLLVSPILPRDGAPAYVAAYDVPRGRLVIVPAATQPSRAGTPYLWLVPHDDGEPIGLGSLDPLAAVSIDLDARRQALTSVRASLVITLEPSLPADGASAAGPVMAHGKFSLF